MRRGRSAQVPTTLKPLARAAMPSAESCVANTRSEVEDSRQSIAVERWMASRVPIGVGSGRDARARMGPVGSTISISSSSR